MKMLYVRFVDPAKAVLRVKFIAQKYQKTT